MIQLLYYYIKWDLLVRTFENEDTCRIWVLGEATLLSHPPILIQNSNVEEEGRLQIYIIFF